jgi:hypothetical protein
MATSTWDFKKLIFSFAGRRSPALAETSRSITAAAKIASQRLSEPTGRKLCLSFGTTTPGV